MDGIEDAGVDGDAMTGCDAAMVILPHASLSELRRSERSAFGEASLNERARLTTRSTLTRQGVVAMRADAHAARPLIDDDALIAAALHELPHVGAGNDQRHDAGFILAAGGC